MSFISNLLNIQFVRVRTFGILLLTLSLCSCTSYKKITYFQDVSRNEVTKQKIDNYQPITIEPEDILGINVSSLNSEASAVFNYNLNTSTGTAFNSTNTPVVGYLVDQKGEIQLPLLGNMKVSGYTTSDLRSEIKKKIVTVFKGACCKH